MRLLSTWTAFIDTNLKEAPNEIVPPTTVNPDLTRPRHLLQHEIPVDAGQDVLHVVHGQPSLTLTSKIVTKSYLQPS